MNNDRCMNDFSHNKEELNRELERFIQTLNEVLPRYSSLLKKTNVTKEELAELGEIEHFLIGMNYQISEIKERIEQDLFGHTCGIIDNQLAGRISQVQCIQQLTGALRHRGLVDAAQKAQVMQVFLSG